MMRTIPIVFTFDASLVMPAGVCMTSLLMNAAPETFYDIFVLHSAKVDLASTPLAKIPEQFPNCRITFRAVEGEFVGAYEIRGIPETAYYRLLAPEIIPEYDKLMYSDVDVVFREDMWDYYNVDLGDNYFAAVDNCSVLRPDVQEYLRKELGLDYHNGYYYSGNLVINSRAQREDGLLARFRELGKNNYKQQDMDIINIACNKKILPFGPSFCLTNYLYDLIVKQRSDMQAIYGEEELAHALKSGIVHYNGPKPWKEACLNMDIWWDYYRNSVFFDEAFCNEFHHALCEVTEHLSLMKRVKLLARYFIGGRK